MYRVTCLTYMHIFLDTVLYVVYLTNTKRTTRYSGYMYVMLAHAHVKLCIRYVFVFGFVHVGVYVFFLGKVYTTRVFLPHTLYYMSGIDPTPLQHVNSLLQAYVYNVTRYTTVYLTYCVTLITTRRITRNTLSCVTSDTPFR